MYFCDILFPHRVTYAIFVPELSGDVFLIKLKVNKRGRYRAKYRPMHAMNFSVLVNLRELRYGM